MAGASEWGGGAGEVREGGWVDCGYGAEGGGAGGDCVGADAGCGGGLVDQRGVGDAGAGDDGNGLAEAVWGETAGGASVGYDRELMNSFLQALLQSGAGMTDAALERLLPGPETLPHSIHRAMRHSTFAGGKRLRPVLTIEAAKMTAARNEAMRAEAPEGVAELGAALEMLHTYSLIHDDLPALDNDDLRRGQPTCHVVFGEATAILAGDALQTLAFQTIANLKTPAATTVAILREVAAAVGTGVGRVGEIETGLPSGMIGGQVMDLEGEHQKPTAAMVEAIHRAKTGALFTWWGPRRLERRAGFSFPAS